MVTIRNIIIGLLSCMAWSQETVIKGRFIDHKQQPISSVKIQLLPLNNTVYSNKAGEFTLHL